MKRRDDGEVVDIGPSCTIEVAVGRLMGWLDGTVLKEELPGELRFMRADLSRVYEEQKWGLGWTLGRIRVKGWYRVERSIRNGEPPDARAAVERTALECEKAVEMAKAYLQALESEIGKGRKSTVVLDGPATQANGAKHYTLKSIDKWTSTDYAKIATDRAKAAIGRTPIGYYPSGDYRDSIEAELAPSVQLGRHADRLALKHSTSGEPDWSDRSREGFLLTLALLLDAFAEKDGSKYQHANEHHDAKLKTIADELETRCTKLFAGDPPWGQKSDSIRIRLRDARAMKYALLPPKLR